MGFKVNRNTPPMKRELIYLLYDLCVNWGWFIPPESQEIISNAKNYSAQSFAKDVINAEGLDADYELKYVRDIANKFTERFGTNQIEMKTFVDRVRANKENW